MSIDLGPIFLVEMAAVLGAIAWQDYSRLKIPNELTALTLGVVVTFWASGTLPIGWLDLCFAAALFITSIFFWLAGKVGAGDVKLLGVVALPVGIAGEGGIVRSVLVDAGTWVHAGQVLAVVDRSVQVQQVASQAAGVQVQEANARIAQSNLDRALKLVAKGFISKADIDQLTATRDAAVAQVRVARATLGQLRASTARLNIVAPADGLVLTRAVEPGQIVSAGSGTLFRMAKDGELEMQARLAEVDLARMHVGVTAQITPVGTAQSFTGTVWQVAPTIDPTTREGIARIALRYDPALRPGGFASATIRSGVTTAPVLPETAILSDENGSFVYILDGANKVTRRAVKIGDVTAHGIVVREGLSGNERVVLRAGGFLNPGDTVRPVTAGTAAAAH